jgi:hypothetical protein
VTSNRRYDRTHPGTTDSDLVKVAYAGDEAEPAARDILREVDTGEPGPPSRSGVADRPPRVRAALLIAVALVGLVVCLAADVFP